MIVVFGIAKQQRCCVGKCTKAWETEIKGIQSLTLIKLMLCLEHQFKGGIVESWISGLVGSMIKC